MRPYNLLFTATLCVVFGLAAWMALGFTSLARIYPLVVGLLGAVFCLAELANTLFRRPAPAQPSEDTVVNFRDILPYLAWLAGFYAVIYAVGFLAASGAFIAAFLRFEAKVGIVWSIVAAVLAVSFLLLLSQVLGLTWPRGNILRF